MKIIHLCESITGGIATYLNELIPVQLEKYGKENIKVVVSEEQMSEICFEKSNISTFGTINRNSLVKQVSMLISYIRLVRKFNPNVIHLHSTFSGFWFRLYLLLTMQKKYTVIYCSHGWAFDRETSLFNKQIIKVIERALQIVTTKIVCISENDYKTALNHGLNPEKLKIIKNSVTKFQINKSISPKLPGHTRNFLFVGRFDKQKGFDLITSALKRCNKNDINVYCIGDFVVSKNTKDDLVDDRLTFLGWRTKEEVLSYMSVCDVLLVPSRWEGFGLVAIESLLANCPVFHSGAGGLAEHHRDTSFYRKITSPVDVGLLEIFQQVSKDELTHAKADLERDYNYDYSVKQLAIDLDKLYRC
ncbi:glycosyltransferase [Alteromonas sp. NFXS44]|uniref:glycosyltransferase n=1 Tax=Alteromonas sp. NFXS44 TaxID=2818435 RepID=UPI0032DF7813